MVKTKNSTPTSPPTTSTSKTANKLYTCTALREASDTLNFPDYLGMRASLLNVGYWNKTALSFRRTRPLWKDDETITLCTSGLPSWREPSQQVCKLQAKIKPFFSPLSCSCLHNLTCMTDFIAPIFLEEFPWGDSPGGKFQTHSRPSNITSLAPVLL